MEKVGLKCIPLKSPEVGTMPTDYNLDEAFSNTFFFSSQLEGQTKNSAVSNAPSKKMGKELLEWRMKNNAVGRWWMEGIEFDKKDTRTTVITEGRLVCTAAVQVLWRPFYWLALPSLGSDIFSPSLSLRLNRFWEMLTMC